MKKEKQLLKIVYFDEGAATDFIYIFEGGKSEEHKENIISKTNSHNKIAYINLFNGTN